MATTEEFFYYCDESTWAFARGEMTDESQLLSVGCGSVRRRPKALGISCVREDTDSLALNAKELRDVPGGGGRDCCHEVNPPKEGTVHRSSGASVRRAARRTDGDVDEAGILARND